MVAHLVEDTVYGETEFFSQYAERRGSSEMIESNR
jgi:hypothetical protein